MRRPSAIEVGQLVCVALVVVAVFLLLPVAWAMLAVGLAGAVLLTALEFAARPAPELEPPADPFAPATWPADVKMDGA